MTIGSYPYEFCAEECVVNYIFFLGRKNTNEIYVRDTVLKSRLES